jgi:hypothetical protein
MNPQRTTFLFSRFCEQQLTFTSSHCRQEPHTGTARSRRNVTETGSFGKSTRRSRSRTGTPGRGRENPTLAAADKLFGDWVASNQAAAAAQQSSAQSQQQQQQQQDDTQSSQGQQAQQQPQAQQLKPSRPVPIILRGYHNSDHQYAAIAHFEALAGAILEDYPREPPKSQSRYNSVLRDPAFTRRRALTPEERNMVNRADGGEHWIKVTFESSEAADAAISASPQRILGYLVYAEDYRGLPPARDESCPDLDSLVDVGHERSKSMPATLTTTPRKASSGLPTSFSSRLLDLSGSPSAASTQTAETGTLSNTHSSSTVIDPWAQAPFTPSKPTAAAAGEPLIEDDGVFCRRIPTARRARLLPAEQALRPQQSFTQRFLGAVPFLSWFGGSIIGNEVPRTDAGDFDWNRASLYWKLMWWLDANFGLFRGDIVYIDKDE